MKCEQGCSNKRMGSCACDRQKSSSSQQNSVKVDSSKTDSFTQQ